MSHALPRLQIHSNNPHLLQTEDGNPFLMIGDTAWELFHRLTNEEAIWYFDQRKRQKFNMIWAVVLAEFDGLRTPDRYGQLPLIDEDPSKLNEEYFARLDMLIQAAADRGLYVGLLPTWGDKVTAPWGAGPRIFDVENAYNYANFLAKRYKNQSNLLWVLGGDRPPKIEEGTWMEPYAKDLGLEAEDWTPIWDEFARGIIDGTDGKALITYHPQGGSERTSRYLHDKSWLHLNAMQTGHGNGRDQNVDAMIAQDYAKLPPKPTFDAEPCYEDHPVSPWPTWDPKDGYFDEYDVRRTIYRGIFAGGCGVIYGHHSVWQFASEHKPWVNHAKMDWKTAVLRPGAEQLWVLRSIFEDVDFAQLRPADEFLVNVIGEGGDEIRALATNNHILVYMPHSSSVEIAGAGEKGTWVDPRSGEKSLATKIENRFYAPNDIDWVVIVERE
jgi:hypothetical protein